MTVNAPYEKRKRMSYTALFKRTVIKDADASSDQAAAKKHGVTECMVRSWKKDRVRLFKWNKSRRPVRGPKKGRYSMENIAAEYVQKLKKLGLWNMRHETGKVKCRIDVQIDGFLEPTSFRRHYEMEVASQDARDLIMALDKTQTEKIQTGAMIDPEEELHSGEDSGEDEADAQSDDESDDE